MWCTAPLHDFPTLCYFPNLCHLFRGGTLADTYPYPVVAQEGTWYPREASCHATAPTAGSDGVPLWQHPGTPSHSPRQLGKSQSDPIQNRAPRPLNKWQSQKASLVTAWQQQGAMASMDSRVTEVWVQVLRLPATHCATLGCTVSSL